MSEPPDMRLGPGSGTGWLISAEATEGQAHYWTLSWDCYAGLAPAPPVGLGVGSRTGRVSSSLKDRSLDRKIGFEFD